MAALDKNTGSVLWKCPVPSLPGAAYGSPIVADVGGSREYINVVSRGVVGVKADGTFLWANDAIGNANVICASPLFIKDYVLVSASYNAGAALIHLTPSEQGGIQADLVYHSTQIKNHHGGMVAIGNYVYGADDQVLTCFSLDTGKTVWKNRSVGKCSLTCADGHLYVRGEENGAMALVEQPRTATTKWAGSFLRRTITFPRGLIPSWRPASSSCAIRTTCSATRSK